MGQSPITTPTRRPDDLPEHGAASTRLGEYLRNLRQGYRYTLRKVEERATALGESIDNSQLSRFEKGKAVPSFDKLRALARVFNVPVQNFSDVLDLEEYRDLCPDLNDYEPLIKVATEAQAQGDHGAAFATYERALELAEAEPDGEQRAGRVAAARIAMATTLKMLGKLYMAEHELRKILRDQAELPVRLRIRTLLQMAYLYRELGDYFLATILAKESLALAESEGDQLTVAGVLNTLGNVAHDEHRPDEAESLYRRALTILEQVGGFGEFQGTVLTNLGGCLVTLERYDEGLPMLREAHTRARRGGFRRVAALSLTRLAEAQRQRGQRAGARETLNDSDALASRAGDAYHDILFLNAFHRWEMARDEGNDTREKIAFGRLRHLRSSLQRRFAEVDTFDRYVENDRR